MEQSLPPELRQGWEEAHAAGVATGQDGGADKGAVLLPGPSPCLEAALPPSGRGFDTGLEEAMNHMWFTEIWCVAPPFSLSLSPFLKVLQRLCCIP